MIQKIVRVDVDTQHGFCHPKGGLYVQGAEAVLPVVARLNAHAQAMGHVLLGSVDTHESYSKEFKENGGVWPVHCVKGTWDWLKVPETLPKRFLVVANARYERPIGPSGRERTTIGQEGVALYFEKDLYSLFDNLNADPIVRRLGDEGALFQVYGVATDYCVKAAALGIRERCPHCKVQLLRDAVAGVTRDGSEQAVAEMKAKGVEVVDSADVL